MTYDAYTRVSHAQSLAAAPSGAAVSEKSIDLLSNGTTPRISGRDIGPGTDITRFRIHITTAFDGSAGNLAVSVAFCTDAALTTGTFVPALTIVNARLVAGAEFDVPIPTPTLALIGGDPTRFIGLKYVSSTGAIVAGALSAFVPLGHSPGLPRKYAANYTGPS